MSQNPIGNTKVKNILIIEDNRDILDNTFEILKLEGYKVMKADNGNSGLYLAQTNSPDVIICDIWMPGLNGYEVFEQLKKNKITSHIPFIFLTASADKHEVETGLGMGADGYIRKPFEPEDLISEIERCALR